MTKKNALKNLVVQYRTGEWTGSRILDLAAIWKVTTHEVARRLMLLAMFRLTLDCHPVIEKLANAVGGGNNFLRACDMVLAALHADELTRKESRRKPRTELERLAFLERWAHEFATGEQVLPGVPRRIEASAISDQVFADQANTAQCGELSPYRNIRKHQNKSDAGDPTIEGPAEAPASEREPEATEARRRIRPDLYVEGEKKVSD